MHRIYVNFENKTEFTFLLMMSGYFSAFEMWNHTWGNYSDNCHMSLSFNRKRLSRHNSKLFCCLEKYDFYISVTSNDIHIVGFHW